MPAGQQYVCCPASAQILFPIVSLGNAALDGDQRQSGRFVDLAGEKAGRFDDQHFECGLHPAFQQMSAVGGAVGFSDHDMSVDLFLSTMQAKLPMSERTSTCS